MTINISPLAESHLDAVWRIEQTTHSHPWTQSMINNLNSRGACHYALLDGEQLIGYFYAQNIVGEVTLLNVAVDPLLHGKGFGRCLMEHFLDICQNAKADSAWLEVRESNNKAFQLYESLGFNEVDRRVNYYPCKQGKEDAIIMSYLFF